MSRLVHINPTSQLEPEPEGFEFGELKVDEEEELNEMEAQDGEEQNNKKRPGRGEFKITVREDDEEAYFRN